MAFLFIILSLSISCYEVGARNINPSEMQHSFTRSQAVDRDFDCVDIYKQFAFEHPLLKNHKIQLKPTFSRDRMQSRSSHISNAFKTHNFTRRCPPGKVPIHRIKMRQQIRNSISSESQIDNIHQYSQDYPGHHFATLDTTTQNVTYYGASATISIYNLSLQGNQYSMSQVWLQNGSNIIKVGLGVYPSLYHDMRTRVTGFWTVDNFQNTGCVNTKCPGFIQVDGDIFLGSGTKHQSTVGTDVKFSNPFTVKRDPSSGNWWLHVWTVDAYVDVGYWPKELFTSLAEGSSLIRFGGETYSPPNMPSPPMGSGMLPQTHFRNAAFLSELQIVDSNYNQNDVIKGDMKRHCDTSSDCYDLLYDGYQGPDYKQAILFGGPGGQCGRV